MPFLLYFEVYTTFEHEQIANLKKWNTFNGETAPCPVAHIIEYLPLVWGNWIVQRDQKVPNP